MGTRKAARITGLLCAILPASMAAAAPFTFTKIADSAGGYSGFSTPTVNSSGTAAFIATTGGTGKIFTGAGGAVTTALDPASAGLSNLIDAASINNGGRIAFVATGPGANPPGGSGINVYRVDPGGAVTRVFDATSVAGESYHATMGPDDNVYFSAKSGAVSQFLAKGNGGAYSQIGAAVPKATQGMGRAAVAPNGQNAVTFSAPLGGGQFLEAMSANGVGLAVSPFLDPVLGPPVINQPSPLTEFSQTDINSNGKVVFSAFWASLSHAIYTYENGTLTDIMVGGPAIPAINDQNMIAALFTSGTKHLAAGIGKPSDTILSVGDAFMGSTVTDLDFQSGGLSEGNQLAFYAALADGRSGIYVTSVPEPGVLGLVTGVAILLRRRRRLA